MARLIIRNIGPIKNVDIELNKVNVFIGEQSSGKSTIAKIVSFCLWLEKTVNKDDVFFGEGKEAYRRLQTYHHIQSYFREDSVICYLGENLAYAYNWPAEEPMPYPGWEIVDSQHFSEKEFFYTLLLRWLIRKLSIFLQNEISFLWFLICKNMPRMTIT